MKHFWFLIVWRRRKDVQTRPATESQNEVNLLFTDVFRSCKIDNISACFWVSSQEWAWESATLLALFGLMEEKAFFPCYPCGRRIRPSRLTQKLGWKMWIFSLFHWFMVAESPRHYKFKNQGNRKYHYCDIYFRLKESLKSIKHKN